MTTRTSSRAAPALQPDRRSGAHTSSAEQRKSSSPSEAPVIRGRVIERRSQDPVNVLGRQMNDVCTSAVDPLEIAATLEAEGINDRIARERYGCRDVFTLAEQLFNRIPLRIRERKAKRTQRRATLGHLARGGLFGLPGLFYIVAQGLLDSKAAAIALLISSVAGWGLSQAMSILGHTMIGRGNPRGAMRMLAATLGVGLLLMAVGSGAGVAFLGWDSGIVLATTIQIVYIMSATVLLLLDRDLILWLAFLPGVGASVGYIVGGPSDIGRRQATIGILVTVVLTFQSALLATFVEHRRREPGGPALRLGDLKVAVPFTVYGILAGGFLAAPVMWAVAGSGLGSSTFGATMTPLVLSMGVAEWQLRRYRERTQRFLAGSTDHADFMRYSWREFVRSLGIYVGSLVLLTAIAAVSVAIYEGGLRTEAVLLFGSYTALGAGFYIALVLIACQRVVAVLPCLFAAVVAYCLALALGQTGTASTACYLLTCTFLLSVLLAVGRHEIRLAVNHR